MSTVKQLGTPVEGSVALVTGASRGFGRALVDELVERGAAKVYATSRSPLEPWTDRVAPLILDVTDDNSVAAAVAEAGDVSILINNAGVQLGTNVLTAPLDNIRTELDTNLFGILRMTRAFAPILAANSPSALVNVLSVLSWISFGRGYEISKAAGWSATNAIRELLRDQETTVTALHVAYMDTEMAADVDAPKADPREIARTTVDAIINGHPELLADDTTRAVKAALGQPLVPA